MTIDDCHALLHDAGWSVGCAKFGALWFVDGTNGENAILARGVTQGQAWRQAVEQAHDIGMLRNRVVVQGGRF